MTGAHGDEALATRLRELMGEQHPVVAAATVSSRGVRTASVGAGIDADFEIGSISKGITGLRLRVARPCDRTRGRHDLPGSRSRACGQTP